MIRDIGVLVAFTVHDILSLAFFQNPNHPWHPQGWLGFFILMLKNGLPFCKRQYNGFGGEFMNIEKKSAYYTAVSSVMPQMLSSFSG